jgi:amidophosphoribosyltransferase
MLYCAFCEAIQVRLNPLEGMLSCASLPKDHYCTACWSGSYPIPVQMMMNKFTMERYQMKLFNDEPIQL